MPRLRTHAFPTNATLAQLVPYIATITTLFSLSFVSGCSAGADAQAAAATDYAVPVRVLPVAATPFSADAPIEVTGTLAGKEEVALAFKIGGVIERVTVHPGEHVRAGQLLAELRLTEVAAQVASALESERKAERDLARVTRLHADSVTTLEQLQDARTALQVATNTLRIARFNAEYAVIRAPGDGVVLARGADAGQVVDAGRAVLTVRRNGGGMVVRVGLPDRSAIRVRVGDMATVRFDAVPGQSFAARVTQRAAAASAGTGDYAAELSLANADALPTGLVARVTLRTGATPSPSPASSPAGPVTVPLDALVDADADSAAVFVLSADRSTVSRRVVKLTDVTEALHTARVPVVSGLAGTEHIIIAGMSRLVDGSRVRVIATPAQRNVSDASVTRSMTP